MKHFYRYIGFLSALFLCGCQNMARGVLNPQGLITYQERRLLFDAAAFMLIVVIPVIIMSFAFVRRYHQAHKTSDYQPHWHHNIFFESIWWGVPCIIILILGIMTWKQSHQLDPYRRIDMPGEPLLIQAIALPWKWLFIYPKENIAAVNDLYIPEGQQVEFWMTCDNVAMSAFFIPQLGSQIYVMAGMRTRLHLVAARVGNYLGLNAQFNGEGFSDMNFITHVVSPSAFTQWVSSTQQSGKPLTDSEYQQLLKPAIAYPVQYYSSVSQNLFQNVIQVYITPGFLSHPRVFVIPSEGEGSPNGKE